MAAIPESPGHWRYEDVAFWRWLIQRGETLMAILLLSVRYRAQKNVPTLLQDVDLPVQGIDRLSNALPTARRGLDWTGRFTPASASWTSNCAIAMKRRVSCWRTTRS